jgi:copper homeostasis protein (lipoprotein)
MRAKTAAVTAGLLLACMPRVPSAGPADGRPTMGGEFTYMADAARFTECLTGKSYPVAMEADFIALERAYLAAAEGPGAPLYVTFGGAIVDRPRMEGEGAERTVVVTRFINVWPDQRCERARAHATLGNTYWRIVRLDGETVRAAPGRREPHLLLRNGDGRTGYRATVGCNRLAGGYEVGDGSIRFTPAAATLLPCPPPLDGFERALVQALTRARGWRITANTLELFDEAGAPVALLEAIYL